MPGPARLAGGPPSLNRFRSAFSLIETMVGVFLFAAMFLPAYTLFVQSRNTVFKSKLAYISVQAAREEIEDLRILSRVKQDTMEKLAHDWAPFKGNALDRLKEVMLAGETPPKELDYGEEYGRIWTKVEIGQPQDGFAYACVLHVRWQEKGEAFNAASTKDKEGFSRFDFFLVRTPRGL